MEFRIHPSEAHMVSVAKFVAVVAAIALLTTPVAAPVHCILMGHPGTASSHKCHMTDESLNAEQIAALPADFACCHVSASRPESNSVAQSPSETGLVARPAFHGFLSDVQTIPVLPETSTGTLRLSGESPQAFLCTFLI
jgi:hypothetical protein